MAIQKSYVDRFGSTHAEAYSKIKAVTVENAQTHILLEVYHNAAARSKSDATAQKPFIDQVWGLAEGSDFTTYFADSVLVGSYKSPLKQGYAWVKTQDNILDMDFTTGTTDV